MQIEAAKWYALFWHRARREFQAHHDHAGVPEKQNVVGADQQAGGIKFAQVGRGVRPAEGCKWPERRAEPGVEDVGILCELRAAAFRALRRGARRSRMSLDDFDARIRRWDHLLAVRAMPDRNAMAPPELARDAPVANVFEPLQQNRALIVGHDFDEAIEHG